MEKTDRHTCTGRSKGGSSGYSFFHFCGVHKRFRMFKPSLLQANFSILLIQNLHIPAKEDIRPASACTKFELDFCWSSKSSPATGAISCLRFGSLASCTDRIKWFRKFVKARSSAKEFYVEKLAFDLTRTLSLNLTRSTSFDTKKK
jgi:hypothetical protein